mmetsp:Transcript_139351/g.445630  ORF Transcript_139351/g.445630 Transcript_139351/m.445630 type:complete len:1345 (-) Transcript_139351:64-4098(-)
MAGPVELPLPFLTLHPVHSQGSARAVRSLAVAEVSGVLLDPQWHKPVADGQNPGSLTASAPPAKVSLREDRLVACCPVTHNELGSVQLLLAEVRTAWDSNGVLIVIVKAELAQFQKSRHEHNDSAPAVSCEISLLPRRPSLPPPSGGAPRRSVYRTWLVVVHGKNGRPDASTQLGLRVLSAMGTCGAGRCDFVSHYIMSSTRSFQIGSGVSGDVFPAEALVADLSRSGEEAKFAVKVLRSCPDKTPGSSSGTHESWKREVAMLAAVQGHPNVVRFRGLFWLTDCESRVESLDSLSLSSPSSASRATTAEGAPLPAQRKWALLMDYCDGGDLWQHVAFCKLTEVQAAQVTGSLLGALTYVHDREIVHRDIKAENVLLTGDGTPVLADWGYACRVSDVEAMAHRVGTPGYIAPEMLTDSKYDEKVDVFSLGVTLFFMLTADLPFSGPNNMGTLRCTVDSRARLDVESFQCLSPSIKDLTRRMLKRIPESRPTAADALIVPWIVNGGADGSFCDETSQTSFESSVESADTPDLPIPGPVRGAQASPSAARARRAPNLLRPSVPDSKVPAPVRRFGGSAAKAQASPSMGPTASGEDNRAYTSSRGTGSRKNSTWRSERRSGEDSGSEAEFLAAGVFPGRITYMDGAESREFHNRTVTSSSAATAEGAARLEEREYTGGERLSTYSTSAAFRFNSSLFGAAGADRLASERERSERECSDRLVSRFYVSDSLGSAAPAASPRVLPYAVASYGFEGTLAPRVLASPVASGGMSRVPNSVYGPEGILAPRVLPSPLASQGTSRVPKSADGSEGTLACGFEDTLAFGSESARRDLSSSSDQGLTAAILNRLAPENVRRDFLLNQGAQGLPSDLMTPRCFGSEGSRPNRLAPIHAQGLDVDDSPQLEPRAFTSERLRRGRLRPTDVRAPIRDGVFGSETTGSLRPLADILAPLRADIFKSESTGPRPLRPLPAAVPAAGMPRGVADLILSNAFDESGDPHSPRVSGFAQMPPAKPPQAVSTAASSSQAPLVPAPPPPRGIEAGVRHRRPFRCAGFTVLPAAGRAEDAGEKTEPMRKPEACEEEPRVVKDGRALAPAASRQTYFQKSEAAASEAAPATAAASVAAAEPFDLSPRTSEVTPPQAISSPSGSSEAVLRTSHSNERYSYRPSADGHSGMHSARHSSDRVSIGTLSSRQARKTLRPRSPTLPCSPTDSGRLEAADLDFEARNGIRAGQSTRTLGEFTMNSGAHMTRLASHQADPFANDDDSSDDDDANETFIDHMTLREERHSIPPQRGDDTDDALGQDPFAGGPEHSDDEWIPHSLLGRSEKTSRASPSLSSDTEQMLNDFAFERILS